MHIIQGLSDRELGLSNGRGWPKQIISSRHASLKPTSSTQMKHESGSINWLDLDESEGRYLISVSSQAELSIWDTQSEASGAEPSRVAFLPRSTASGHRHSLVCCQWWPTDTGLFITASDKHVRLFDTNSLTSICTFSGLQGRATISRVSPGSSLIATGSLGSELRLGDPRTGAFTHSLLGHESPVLALNWSLHKGHEIWSADKSGQIFVWDIRRPKALQSLDQFEMAHQGPVFSLVPHPNHLMWISCGGDQRLRLWEGHRETRVNHLVNYPTLTSSTPTLKARQLTFSTCGQTIFVPNAGGVHVIESFSGRSIKDLTRGQEKGGATHTHSIAYDSRLQSVYQGTEDGRIITWRPDAS